MTNKTATDCWNILRGELDSAIDSYVPMKKQGKRSKKKHLSKEAFRKIRYKQNMWRVYKHTGKDTDYDAYNTYTTNVNCLYVIQKKLVRIIHHEGRLAHTNCLFQQMHSLKFHDLVKYRTAIVMFKLYYGKLPTLLQSRFMRSQNIHNTRSKNTFIVRYSRTNLKAM